MYVKGNYTYVAMDLGLQVIEKYKPLEDITLIDSGTITATVPSGTRPGMYNLHIRNPNGGYARIFNAFTIYPNQSPKLTYIGDKIINEGQFLQFIINAIDSDGDNLIFSVDNLPMEANFDSNTREFSWTPNYTQAGDYFNVHFEVSDGDLIDIENITITVHNVNRAPIFDHIKNQAIKEGKLLQFIVTATDPDGDELTYSASDLPNGANFAPNIQEVTWMPNYSQAGSYNLIFTVTDNSTHPLIDSETITIKVINKSRPSSYDSYYGYGWYSGLYTQGYQYWNVTNYQQQLWNNQLLSNWSRPMLQQVGQFWPILSQTWQQQTWVKPFALQSYTPSTSQLQSLPQLKYQHWDFRDYQQQQPWNVQKSWEQPIFQLEQYFPNLSCDWYKQAQKNWNQPLTWDIKGYQKQLWGGSLPMDKLHFTGYQQQVFDLQKQQQLLNLQKQKPWPQMFQPSSTWP